jgi:AcrR family transcriptional regulator
MSRSKASGERGEQPAQRPRRGREQTSEAILDAAEELFARGGPEGVSVREIAAQAGISHALVHRYLGSKQEVYKAVLNRDQERILRATGDATDLAAALPLMFAEVLGPRRQYATLLTHSSIHGLPRDAVVQGHALRRLLQLAAAEPEHGREAPTVAGLDHRFVVGAIVAMLLGWIALEPWMRGAIDLDLTDEQVRGGLNAMALRMLDRGD